MILDRQVELFGKPEGWANFRHFPKLWIRRPPDNYTGHAAPGTDIYDDEHIRFLSGYKVAVCLENSVEPHYFTEKFVNAARAGCIPVYQAHPTVRNRFLSSAKWVDPADFDFSAERTIKFALVADQSAFREQNDDWLRSGVLAETDDGKTLSRLHMIVEAKLRQKDSY
jgi:Glycosyltransferase family 10 (fucosyltransferase) C-term